MIFEIWSECLIHSGCDTNVFHVQGVPIPLSPPPQTSSGVVQTIQIHRGKLEPISAIDFKGF